MRTNLKHYASAAFLLAALFPILSGGGASAAPGQTASLAAPPACGAAQTTGTFAGTTGSIGSAVAPGVFTGTINVAGLGPYLWDVNVTTTLLHVDSASIDITLTSPAGTVVILTTDNGGTNDHVFNGTLWDDNVNLPITDAAFTNNVAETPVSPEGRLEAFRGEDPNGTWTIRIMDDTVGVAGSVTDWSLDISTLAGAPVETSGSFTTSPNSAIPSPGLVIGNLLVSGLGNYLKRVTVYVEIPHTDASELDLTLQGPSGTPFKLDTDNGSTNDNVFNGTLFDSDAPVPVTDAVYANLVAETPVSPEGPPDHVLGIDPNGVWSLIVNDDTTGTDVGTLKRWDVNVTTIATPSPSAPVNFAGAGGPLPDAVTGVSLGTFVFTANVGGLPTTVWDVDLTTELLHQNATDLDVTLTSPGGTVVKITTDNGGSNDDIYNGTLWDDNANDPVTDHVYTNNVPVAQLSPEGRLARFRGENPNGVWTLTVTDDLSSNVGELNSWSLAIAAIASAPAEVLTLTSQSPGLAIPDAGQASDVMAIAGMGVALTEVELYVEILHTESADLEIFLTSPAGTTVLVTSDNGGASDNVFNGTLYDPSQSEGVVDATYANNVVESPISPEGSFDNFVGQNPNGNWTLLVRDDLATDVGTLVRWDLKLRTCAAPPPAPYCFGDGTGTACPCTPMPLIGDPDKGCPNGFNAGGGKLTATGLASISSDSLVMTCTTINNGGAVVFQGTNDNGGGLGTAFGDGLRCAAGSVRRMRSHSVTTNTHQYPDPMFGDNAISIRGAVVAPGDRWYQGWYRSGLAHCDPTQNYNLTNGVKITWVP